MKREALRVKREQLSFEVVALLNKPGRRRSLALVSEFGGPVRAGHCPRDGSLYDPNTHPKQVYRLRLAGLTATEIADVLMISIATLTDWRKLHYRLDQAWREGGAHADAKVVKALFARATGYKHATEKVFYNSREDKIVRVPIVEKYAPDTSAIEFWLTNRQGQRWKKRSSNEHTGADGAPLTPPTIIINPVMSANAIAPMLEGRVITDVEDE